MMVQIARCTRLLKIAVLAVSVSCVPKIAAANEYPQPDSFPSCLAKIEERAAREGISTETRALVIPELRWLPSVIESDRRQPEFTLSFDRYFTRAVSEKRIQTGRLMLKTHADLLRDLERRYGVPGRYLLAFWGLETNYGGYMGNTSSLDALATLACDTRRTRFFETELLAALHIVDQQKLKPEAMIGSWAGALGQVQFMPTNYRRYGRDGNNDGRIDLFGSTEDALTSAAYFLHELGWVRDQRWGREVKVPAKFDFVLADGRRTLPLAEWKKRGLRNADGGPLPVANFDAALHVPGGHEGPAFLSYQNFAVTKRWNNSNFYALAVGHLADRIAGAPPLVKAPDASAQSMRLETVKQAQKALNALGYSLGKADGIVGSGTRAAIRHYQSDHGLIADGHLSRNLLKSLGVSEGAE